MVGHNIPKATSNRESGQDQILPGIEDSLKVHTATVHIFHGKLSILMYVGSIHRDAIHCFQYMTHSWVFT